jgi:hypothetical protein
MLVYATALTLSALFFPAFVPSSIAAEMPLSGAEGSAGDVEIVIGEDRTIYEYRTNGRLMMIKIVPEKGRPYYMVPADGSPHYTDLDHSGKLYPQWVLFEW